MTQKPIVDRETWLRHRLELLEREKAFTRERDTLTRMRQQMPWVRVDREYRFEGRGGCHSLAGLFGSHGQLVIYHFMFGPDWEAGCPSCSFWADNFDGIDVHLAQRDIRFAVVSRAPWARLQAYQQRMGWRFDWFSSAGSEFNFDFGVSFDTGESSGGKIDYNFRQTDFFSDELPGVSVFVRDPSAQVYHSYSTYARGVDLLNGAYNFIDLTPAGRNESGEAGTQGWVRRHDEYENDRDSSRSKP